VYIVLSIFAMLGYAIQTSLMASYYRRMNPLAAIMFRGLSLGISMLPLLLFSKPGSIGNIFHYPLLLIAAALLASVGNVFSCMAIRKLPVGIAMACQQGMLVISTTLIGFFVFREIIGAFQVLAIALIILGNSILSLQKGAAKFHIESRTFVGLCYGMLAGGLLGCAFAFVAKLSREVDPLAAAYFWEITIGVFCLIFLVGFRKKTGIKKGESLGKVFLGILLYSSPTAIGTGCYALGVNIGPIAIVTSIISTMIIAAAVFSYFRYGERLDFRQMGAIAIVVVAIILLKLSEV